MHEAQMPAVSPCERFQDCARLAVRAHSQRDGFVVPLHVQEKLSSPRKRTAVRGKIAAQLLDMRIGRTCEPFVRGRDLRNVFTSSLRERAVQPQKSTPNLVMAGPLSRPSMNTT